MLLVAKGRRSKNMEHLANMRAEFCRVSLDKGQ